MNKIYKVVWNKNTQRWDVASELTRSNGKGSKTDKSVAAQVLLATVTSVAAFTGSYADAQVAAGAMNSNTGGASTWPVKGSATASANGTAIGANANASINGTAIGTNANASANGTAIGINAKAGQDSGDLYAISVGMNSTAGGRGDIAIGYLAETKERTNVGGSKQERDDLSYGNSPSIAIGRQAIASGNLGDTIIGSYSNNNFVPNRVISQSTIIGSRSVVGGDQSIAVGADVRVVGNSSVAIGGDDVARANDKLRAAGVTTFDGVDLNTLGLDEDARKVLFYVADNKGASYSFDKTKAEIGGVNMPTSAIGDASFAAMPLALSIGTASTAIGVNAITKGELSQALGTTSRAYGLRSNAIGAKSQALGEDAISAGTGAVASDKNTIAIGTSANTTGINNAPPTSAEYRSTPTTTGSILIGANAHLKGAVGRNTLIGDKSDGDTPFVMMGYNTSSQSRFGDTLIGSWAKSENPDFAINQATALGNRAVVYGDQGVALGADTRALGNSSVAIGGDDLDKAAKLLAPLLGVADDKAVKAAYQTFHSDASDKIKDYINPTDSLGKTYPQTAAIGDASLAIGTGSQTLGVASNAIGANAKARGATSTAIGTLARSEGESSIAFGTQAKAGKAGNIALGRKSEAGMKTSTKAGEEHFGANSIAIGDGSVAHHNATVIGVNAKSGNVEGNVVIGFNANANDLGDSVLSTGVGHVWYNNEHHSKAGSSFETSSNTIFDPSTGTQVSSKALKDSSNAVISTSTIAIGKNVVADAGHIAMGEGATAKSKSQTLPVHGTQALGLSVAIGSLANAEGGGIALGALSEANNFNTFAVGRQSVAKGLASNAIGSVSAAVGDGSAAIGHSSQALGNRSIAFGSSGSFALYDSNNATIAKGDNSIAMGSVARTDGASAIAIGEGAQALAKNALAVGVGNIVRGEASGAFGDPTEITGSGSYSVGNDNGTGANALSANNAGVFGNNNVLKGDNSRIVGNNNNLDAAATNTFVMGNNVQSALANSVILGNSSDGAAVFVPTSSATVGHLNYGGFAGQSDLANGVVSVGSTGAERQIKHVAAGQITATSTDAINGSQLYAVAEKLGAGFKVNNAAGEVGSVRPGDTLKFTGNGVTVTSTGGVTTVDITNAGGGAAPATTTLTVSDGGAGKPNKGAVEAPTTADGTKLVTAANLADTINNSGFMVAVPNSFIKSGSANPDPKLIKAGDTLTFQSTNDNHLSVGLDAFNNTVRVQANVGSASLGKSNEVFETDPTKVIAPATGKASAQYIDGEGNAIDDSKRLATVGNMVHIINNVGWKTASGGNTATGNQTDDLLVKAGDKVTFNAGDGLTVKREGGNYTFAANIDSNTLEFDNGKLKVKNVPTGGAIETTELDVQTDVAQADAGKAKVAGTGNDGKMVTAKEIADTINEAGFTLKASGANGSLVNAGESVDLKNTDNNILVTKEAGSNDVTFNLANTVTIGTGTGTNPVTINGTAGTIGGLTNKTFNPASIVSGQAASEDQLKALWEASGFKVTAGQVNNGTNTGTVEEVDVKNGNVVAFKADNGINIKQDGKNFEIGAKVDNTTIGIDSQGRLFSKVTGGAAPETTTLTVSDGTAGKPAKGSIEAPVGTEGAKFVNATKLAETINGVGFTAKLGDGTDAGELINAGDALSLKAGKNIAITRNNSEFEIKTADDVTFTSVTSDAIKVPTVGGNPITINKDGIDMAGKPVSNLTSTLPNAVNAASAPAHTSALAAPSLTDAQKTNAATLGDVLNAGWNLQENTVAKDFVKAYDTVNFANGNATTANVSMNADGTVATVKYDLKYDTNTLEVDGSGNLKVKNVPTGGAAPATTGLTVADVGTVSVTGGAPKNGDFVTAGDLANTFNTAGIQVAQNGTVNNEAGKPQLLNAGNTLNFADGTNTVANVTSTADGTTVKFDAATTALAAAINGAITAPAAGEGAKLVNATTLASAINGTGFTLTASGANGSLVKPGSSVDLKAGDNNIVINKVAGNNDVSFELANTVTIGKGASAKPVTINGNAGTITGLTNTSFNPATTYSGGQAATQEQLKALYDASGFKLTTAASAGGRAEGTSVSPVKNDQTVTLRADNGIKLIQAGNTVGVGINVGTGLQINTTTGALEATGATATPIAPTTGDMYFHVNTGSNTGGDAAANKGSVTDSAGAQAIGALAAGMNAQATTNAANGVAVGTSATVTERDAIAVGNTSKASGEYALAIGRNSKAEGYTSIAIGQNAEAKQVKANVLGTSPRYYGKSIAIGNDSKASNDYSLALGDAAKATGEYGTAIGVQAQASQSYSTALGVNANASGNFSLAIGKSAIASGERSSAIGLDAKTLARDSLAIGRFSTTGTDAAHANAIGFNSQVNAERSTAIGLHNELAKTAKDTYVLGQINGKRAGLHSDGNYYEPFSNGTLDLSKPVTDYKVVMGENSVILGAGSFETSANHQNVRTATLGGKDRFTSATAVDNATVNGIEYAGFAGDDKVGGIVSVGKADLTRQIINVAPGEIAENSTDAINGSQLYMTNKALGNVAATTAKHLGGGVTVGTDGNLTAPAYSVVDAAGNQYLPTGKTENAANVGDAISNLNAYVNEGFTIKNNDGTVTDKVTPKDSVQFVNGNGTTSKVETDATNNTTKISFDVASTTLKVSDGTGTTPKGQVETPATGDATKFVNAGDLATAINNVGFRVKKEGETTDQLIKAGEVVSFEEGKNIAITRTDGKFTVATKDEVTFTKVTSNTIEVPTGAGKPNITISSTGIDAAGTPITNVQSALDTYGAADAPKTGLVNLSDKTKAPDGNVATVGDLRNMGFIVSSDKKTGDLGNAFSNQVRNAGEVKFVGTGAATVSANNAGDVNTITVHVEPSAAPTTAKIGADASTGTIGAEDAAGAIKGGQAPTDANALVKAGDVIEAVNNAFWKVSDGKATGGVTEQVKAGTQVNFVDGTGTKAVVSKVGENPTVTFNVDTTTLEVSDGSATTPAGAKIPEGQVVDPTDPNQIATAGSVANAINKAGFTLTASGANGSLVNAGESVDLKNTDGNILISKVDTNNDVTFNLANTVTIGTGTGTNPVTINGTAGTIGGLTNTSFNPATTYSGGQAATQEQLKALWDQSGFKVTAGKVNDGTVSGEAETNVGNGDLVTFKADNGIKIKQDGKNFEIGAKVDGTTISYDADGNLTYIGKAGSETVGLTVEDTGSVKAPATADESKVVTAKDLANTFNNTGIQIAQNSAVQNDAAGKPQLLNAGNTLNFANGAGTVAEVSSDAAGTTVKFNVAQSALNSDAKTGIVTAATPDNFATAGSVATAINEAGFIAKTNGAGGTDHLVKTGQTLNLNQGKNIAITQNAGTFTVATTDDVSFNNVNVGDTVTIGAAGAETKLTSTANGLNVAKADGSATKITNVAAGTNDNDAVNFKQLKDTVGAASGSWRVKTSGNATESTIDKTNNVVTINGDALIGVTHTDQTISITATKGSLQAATAAVGGGAPVATGKVEAPANGIATTGDVATAINSAFWTANDGKGSATSTQQVKAGTAVQFVDGAGTTSKVGVDASGNPTVTFDVASTTLKVSDGTGTTPKGQVETPATGDATKFVNAGDLATAMNSVGFRVKKEGETTDQLIKAGEVVSFEEGKNIAITRTDGKFTVATKEDVTFTSVTSDTIKVPTGAGKPSITISSTGIDAANTPITNVQSALDKYTTDPRTGLVDLSDKTKAPDGNVATVGDLRNMGFIVSSDKKTGDLGNAFSNQVRNAGEVKFVGTGLATVSANNAGDVNTITVDVDAQKTVEAAQTPVVYTDDKGEKLVKVGNDFYKTSDIDPATGKPIAGKTPVDAGDVIASMNNGGNSTTTPMALANIKSNLADATNSALAGGTRPAHTTNLAAPVNADAIKNNAATVGDVLNSGFNLQGNGNAVDFVKAYDTVNFVNGRGTQANVTLNDAGTVADITFNSALAYVDPAKPTDTSTPTNTVKLFGGDATKPVQMGNLASGVRGTFTPAIAGSPTSAEIVNAIKDANGDTLNNAVNVGDLKATLDNAIAAGNTKVESPNKTITVGSETDRATGATTYKIDVANVGLGITDGSTTGVPAGQIAAPKAGDKNKFVNAGDLTTAINGTFWTANDGKGSATSTQQVKAGTAVQFVDGAGTTSEVGVDASGNPTVTFNVAQSALNVGDGTAGTTRGVVTAATPANFATAGEVAKAINESGFIATTNGAGATDHLVTAGQTLKLNQGTGIAITQAAGEFTIAVDAQKTFESAQTPVVYTDDKGEKLVKVGNDFYKTSDIDPATGKPIAGKTPVAAGDVIASMNSGSNSASTPTTLANVQSNLAPTTSTTDLIGKDGSITTVTKPTTAQSALSTADAAKLNNNAATVGDVLNAGWNLQADGKPVDFVKAYDTVNFKAGANTQIVTETDGAINSIQVNMVGLPVSYTTDAGVPVAKVGDKFYEVGADGKPDMSKPVADASKLLTNVVNPTAAPNTMGSLTSIGNIDSGVKALDGSHRGDKATGSTPIDASSALGANVSKAYNGLADLKAAPQNNAVTAKDLGNLGWVVSATGNDYAADVRNANEVRFTGENGVSIKGETNAEGVRVMTVAVDAQKTVESAQTPVVYTDDKGEKLVKVGNDFYKASDVDASGKPIAGKTPVDAGDVIASMQSASGDTKTTPTTLANVKGNLADALNTATTTGTPRPATHTTNLVAPVNADAIKNNAATVGDVLNSGFNLQANGTAVDFVKAYDTVNFVNGRGTQANVTLNDAGTVANITFNSALGYVNTTASDTSTPSNTVKLFGGDATKPVQMGNLASGVRDTVVGTGAGGAIQGADVLKAIQSASSDTVNNAVNVGDLKAVADASRTTVTSKDNTVTVKPTTDAATGAQTFDLSVSAGKIIAGDSPVVYTKADGTKVTKQPDGSFEDAAGNKVPAGDVIASMQSASGDTKAPTTLANVKGNLAEAINAPETAGTHTTEGKAPTDPKAIANNAATVGDVLNSGWTLQENGTSKDFVKAYDKVNFVNGVGTTANVSMNADGTVANITFNSALGYVNTANPADQSTPTNTVKLIGGNADPVLMTNMASGVRDTVKGTGTGGAITDADVVTALQSASGNTLNNGVNVGDLKAVLGKTNTAIAAAKTEVESSDGSISVVAGTATGGGTKYDITVANTSLKVGDGTPATGGTPKGQIVTPIAADANKFVNAGDLASAINSVGFNLGVGATGTGVVSATSGDELINAGKRVQLNAGNNIAVTQAANGQVTFATKDDVTFNSVTSNTITVPTGTGSKPITINQDGIKAGDKVIGDVASGVSATSGVPVATAGTTYSDEDKKKIAGAIQSASGTTLNNAANIGDLQAIANNIAATTGTSTKNDAPLKGTGATVPGIQAPDRDGKVVALKTYNVHGQTEDVGHTNLVQAINAVSEKGTKFFHTNDGQTFERHVSNSVDSSAAGAHSTAIGYRSFADGNASVSLGANAHAKSENTVAIGNTAVAGGENSIAIGINAQATGFNTISIGNGNIVTGNKSGAFGDPSIINGDNSYSVGNNNRIAAGQTDVFVLGNDVTNTVSNSVFLGTKSGSFEQEGSARAANGVHQAVEGVSHYTYAGLNDANVAGVADAVGIVSVGNATQTRQIQGVAAGVVSATSTDAINGSQLYDTHRAVAGVQNQVVALGDALNKSNKDLRAGIAGANAAAALPQAYLPGKSMVAAGAGTFKGQVALAVGYSQISDNGKLIFKLQGNANTRGDVGASVGLGYQW